MRTQAGGERRGVGYGAHQPIRVDARGPRERAWTVATIVVIVLAVLLIWMVTFTPTLAGDGSPTTEVPRGEAPS